MTTKSENLTHMDTLWTAYVATDPDLSELEWQKRKNTYRQTRRAFARQRRAERLKELAGTAASAVLIVGVLMLLLFGLC